MARDRAAASGNTGIGPHRLLFNPTAEGLPERFPFPSRASLRPLIETWRRKARENRERYGAEAAGIERALVDAPGLDAVPVDGSELRRHRALVERMAQPLFVRADWLGELRGLVSPFGSRILHATDALRKLLQLEDDERAPLWLDTATLYTRILYAYKVVLHTFYGRELTLDQPVILAVPDAAGTHDRYFKLNAFMEFLTATQAAPLPELDDDGLDDLMQHIDDIGLWMERLPPARFRFSGLSVMTLVDVTNEVATTALKDILLRSDANVNDETFASLEREVRTLFRAPNLRLGLASVQADGELNFTSDRKIWNSLGIRDAVRAGQLAVGETLHTQVLREGRALTVRDLQAAASPTAAALLERGIRSLLIAPLRYEGRVVGLLELSSHVPGDLHALARLKLRQIEAIFALAIHKNLVRFENRVTRIIQETYTAIHPTVGWRFRDAAIAIMEHQRDGGPERPPEPIVFPDVYPLFGSADVRGSSNIRNEAVRRDLVEHLGLAVTALGEARAVVPLAVLDELAHRAGGWIERPLSDWSPGEESVAADLIRDEIDPLLDVLRREHTGLDECVGRYRRNAGGERVLARRRRAYEASLQRVNTTIAQVLETEQSELQRIFPHYFEVRRTDGVEHTMYVGSSLVRDRAFDPLYVRNLRLRQLILCCEIARRVRALRSDLAVPLQVAQSIVVQDTPLTIGFRLEEKAFDVEGAFGVRYEMVKKRSDKAIVKGTGERLSQPDRIAVIHSVEREAAEYGRYVAYLQSTGHVTGSLERLELEDMPGVSGLRALRFEVGPDPVEPHAADTLLVVADRHTRTADRSP